MEASECIGIVCSDVGISKSGCCFVGKTGAVKCIDVALIMS